MSIAVTGGKRIRFKNKTIGNKHSKNKIKENKTLVSWHQIPTNCCAQQPIKLKNEKVYTLYKLGTIDSNN